MKGIKKNMQGSFSNLTEEQRVLFRKKLEKSGININAVLNSRQRKVFQSAEKKEYYPISPAQKRLFLLYKINKSSLAYNSPVKMFIGEQVDREVLEDSLEKLVDHQESLRTAIIEINDEPVQIIHKNFTVRINEIQIEKENLDKTFHEFIKPFDLSKVPALRLLLVNVLNEGYYLFTDIHHIFMDLKSVTVLFSEIRAFYSGKILPPLKYHYKDYCQWQIYRQKGERIKKQEEFWIKKFENNRPLLNLPFDFARPRIQSNEGAVVNYHLDKDLTKQIKTLAASQNYTLTMVFLGAYTLFLSKLCDQDDIIVGMPITGRDKQEFDSVVGMFANSLALMQKVDNEITLKDFLNDVKNNIIQALTNREYQFENLVEKVVKERDLSHNPIFDVEFNFGDRNLSLEKLNLPDSIHSSLPVKFDLSIMVGDNGDQFLVRLEYCTKLFKPETIDCYFYYYKELLKQFSEKINNKLYNLELLSNNDKQKILYDFNNTKVDFPHEITIIDLFEEQVQKTPDKVSVIFEDIHLTYKELNHISNQIAWYLKERGINADDLVAIMLDRSIEMLSCILGVLKAGGAYLPIDPNYPDDRKELMIQDSGTSIIICHKDEGSYVSINTILNSIQKSNNPQKTIKSNNISYVIYTSGSTGKPKGAMVEHKGLVNHIYAKISCLELKDSDVIAQTASICFDISVWQFLSLLTIGGRVVIIEQSKIFNQQKFLYSLQAHNVTILEMVPSLMAIFLEHLQTATSKKLYLRYMVPTGEALTRNIVNDWFNLYKNINLINAYGPTEASDDVTHQLISESIHNNNNQIPIGKPIHNTTIYILNTNNQLQPVGVPGELCISGDCLGRGYINNVTLTADKFVENPYLSNNRMYRSGDLARWMHDGTIEFLGRIDHQVKIRGFRVELGEIESCLRKNNRIREAIVHYKEKDGDKYLIAYYIVNSDIQEHEIRAFLSTKLPNYMVPSYFIELKSFPLSLNGKINIKALPEPDHIQRDDYVAPSNSIEELLADIWGSILGLKKVGVLDSFFTIGGDSIKAITVSSKLLNEGYNVSVQDILMHQTIRELAPNIKKAEQISDQSTVTGKIELTPVQKLFFDKGHVDEHYYNQAVMLQFDTLVKAQTIRSVFEKLVEHHDALRMVFYRKNNSIVQENIGFDYPFSLEEYSFSKQVDDRNIKLRIVNEIHAGIDLGKGPLMKLGLFQYEQTSELLIVVHHLVIDGVSWRIIFEDLNTLFNQHKQNTDYKLPLKTDSFKQWSETLYNFANSSSFEKEKILWQSILTSKKSIPKDFPDGRNVYEDELKETFTLNEELTKAILTNVHKAFGTQINDVLLTALHLALEKSFGNYQSVIELEGHGREEIQKSLNINRTVGWFTSFYPVLLESGNNILETLVKVKEFLHSIPNNGIGFGAYKYLQNQENNNIDQDSIVQIGFNYLGQFNVENDEKVFQITRNDIGEVFSARNNRDYELEVLVFANEKSLRIGISYSKNQFKQSTIKELIGNYEFFLKEIIAGCLDKKERVLTPSDLTYKELPIAQLNKLQNELSIQDIYPLSPMQEGLFYHYLINDNSLAYFNQLYYSINGVINVIALKEAAEYLMHRYDIFRTQFLYGQHLKPLQIVLKFREADFSFFDLRYEIKNDSKEVVLEKYRKKDRNRKFDLLKDVLIRLTVLQLSDNEFELILSVHHILIDGWCRMIILNDLLQAYHLINNNDTPSLPPAKQYVEYIKWIEERDNLETGNYWKEYLQDYNEQTIFPKSSTLRIAQDNENKHRAQSCKIEAEKTIKLQEITNKYKITLNTLIQTIWGILLSKYTNKKDVVFGTVVSGRPSEIKGVERMVGLFINTIPVRIKYDENTKIKDLLLMVQDSNIQSTPHHYYPLAEIQANSPLGDNLINHIVAFENFFEISNDRKRVEENEKNSPSDFKMKFNNVFEQTNYDLDIIVIPHEEILVKFTYNPNVFSQDQIDNFIKHLGLIIDQLIEQPEKKIIDIGVLSDQEKQKIQNYTSGDKLNIPDNLSVYGMFEQNVKKYTDRIAIVQDNQFITYGELNKKANCIALELLNRNLQEQEVVAVLLPRSIELFASFIAIIKLGAVYLPIDTNNPISRIDFYIERVSADIIITNDNYINELNEEVQKIDIGKVGSKEIGPLDSIQVTEQHPFYVLFTSGTTGNPKAILIENRGILNLIYNYNKLFNLNSNSIFSQVTSPGFDVTASELWPALTNGSVIDIIPEEIKLEPKLLIEWIVKRNITISFQSTLVAEYLIKQNWPTSNLALKFLLTAGDKLNQYPVESIPFEFYNLYGPTEDSVITTFKKVEATPDSTDVPTIGRPLANKKVYILGKQKELLPIGVPGDLYIAGEGLARGYINNQALNNDKFIPNPFNDGLIYDTGDLAMLLPCGEIKFLGRSDYQVKIRGHRIELEEIDCFFNKHSKIEEVVTDIKLNQSNDKVICTYYISKEKLKPENLKDYIKKYVPDYMVPDFYIPLERFPVSHSGKLDRRLLPVPSIQLNSNIISPRNETELNIHIIWQRVLSLKESDFGINSNFFELGGHSLKITRVIAEILDKFKKHVPIREFIKNPTIEHLARYLNNGDQTRISKIKLTEKKEYYKLSQSQSRFYVLQQLIKSNSYNISIAIEVFGNTDFTRLEKVMYQLICRHENLRTYFKMIGGEPYQFIADPKPILFDYFAADNNEDIKQIISNYPKVYDLSNLFLFSVGCIKISKEKTILMFDCHHIIADAISLNILIQEFVQLSNENILPENKFQYKDYSDWSISKTQIKSLKLQEQYWLEKFKQEVPEIRLYQDKIRPKVKSFKGKNHSINMPDAVLNQLHEFAKNNDVTLNILLFAFYNILISKISGETDINIGTVVSGRKNSEMMNLLGVFVNTLVLRNYPTPEKTFKKFLHEVKENMFNAIENQDFKYEDLIEKLDVEKNMERNPLFEIMYVYNDQNDDVKRRNNSNISIYPPDYQIAKFDLTLEIWVADKINISFNYCTDIFNDDTIDKISHQFKKIILDTLATPEYLLNEIEILSSNEKTKLIKEFNNTDTEFAENKTIVDLFEDQVKLSPYRIAVSYDNCHYSYDFINNKSNEIANLLIKNNIKVQEPVAVILERDVNTIISLLAIIKCGGTYTPIEPGLPINRIRQLIEATSVEIIFCNLPILSTLKDVLNNTSNNKYKFYCLLNDSNYNISSTVLNVEYISPFCETLLQNPGIKISPENFAYIIYTSGSTGLPKGVMVKHMPVINLIEWVNKTYRVNENDKILCVSSLSFDLSVFDIFGLLSCGGCVRIVPGKHLHDPLKLLNIIIYEGITFWDSAPAALLQLIPYINNIKRNDFITSLRLVFLSGDWIPLSISEKIKAVFKNAEVVGLGGATEATVWSNHYVINKIDKSWKSIPYGKPISNAKYYILTDNLKICPVGIPGNLFIGGKCLATGYINEINSSFEKFIQSPFNKNEILYNTGDMARWYEDGNIEFLGRKDFQVKIRGYRIELGEIDYYLNKYSKIDEVVCDVKIDQNNNKCICAYYTSYEDLNSAELAEYIKEFVPGYMVPDYYIPLESFPVTSNGKLDRKSLPKPSIKIQNNIIQPRNETEIIIYEIWQKILKLKENEFGITSNFFELGGHSLSATGVIAEILDKLKKHIPVQEFFVNPTIEHLAKYVNETAQTRISQIKPAEKKEYYKLSPSQKRFYILQQLAKSNSYNISIALEISGKLDYTRLENVMYKLIIRHENLRTYFKMIGGNPYQFISEAKPLKFDYFTTSNKDEINRIIAEYPRVYDLSNLFLFGIGCIKVSTENTILIFDIHHIIADAISLDVIIKELLQLYNETTLPENLIQYKDYSEWTVNKINSEFLKNQEKYWLEQFKKEVPEIRLYHDKVRPNIKSFKGKDKSIELAESVLKQLQKMAQENEVTLNVLIFTIFNILISKISGETDITIGTVVSGRRNKKIMNTIGSFVNTLVLRNYPIVGKSFSEFLIEVKENMLTALENQDYQYEELIEKLDVERNTDRNPLFEIMYSYNDQSENGKRNDTNIRVYPPDYPIAKFDLTLDVWITDKVELSFNYCTDIYNDETIEKISKQFKKIILNILEEPGCLLKDVDILSSDEKNRVLNDFNNNILKIPENMTVLGLFNEKVKEFPDKVAVVDNDRFITYNELNKSGEILAEVLSNKGYGAEQVVAILLPRSIEMIECIVGVLKSGAAYLPIDINSPISRINYQLSQANVKLVLSDSKFINKIDNDRQILNVQNIKKGKNISTKNKVTDVHNLLYMIFTSGTTSNPKGVLIENKGFVNLLYNYRNLFNPCEISICTLSASPGFDAMALELWPSLTSGSSIQVVPDSIRLDPNMLKEWMIQRSITISFQAPIIAEYLIQQHWTDNNNALKKLLTGGDKLNKYPSAKLPFDFYNLYGPTEDSVVTTCKKVEIKQESIDVPSIGRPLANKKVYILGKQKELLPIGVQGGLYVEGIGLARGYINNISLVQDKFIPNPYGEGLIYDTGDQAMWLPNGEIQFLGRKDSQVKIRGYRIEIEEVQQQLIKHEAIDDCVVVAKESKNNEKRLIAYYISKLDIEDIKIKNDIKKILPNYMVPSFFVKVKKFKVNLSGKIDTKSLPNPNFVSSDKLDLPKGVLENKLLNIWKEVLNIESIGVGNNFFDIGGNSLKLIEVNEKISEQLNKIVNVIDLIQYPTIRELSKFLKISDPDNKSTNEEVINKINKGKSRMKDLKSKKQ